MQGKHLKKGKGRGKDKGEGREGTEERAKTENGRGKTQVKYKEKVLVEAREEKVARFARTAVGAKQR